MGVGPSNCRAPLVGGLVRQGPEKWQCQYMKQWSPTLIWSIADVIIIKIKCATYVMCLIILKPTSTTKSVIKLSSMKPIPGANSVLGPLQ